MYNDDSARDNMNMRKPGGQGKYGDKGGGYSPSHSFGHGSGGYNNNGNYNNSGNYNNAGGYNSQHQNNPRRRVDRFKRDTYNHSERLVKQNDIIIRLLKEIRDRLPAPEYEQMPAESSEVDTNPDFQDQSDQDEQVNGNQAQSDQPQDGAQQ